MWLFRVSLHPVRGPRAVLVGVLSWKSLVPNTYGFESGRCDSKRHAPAEATSLSYSTDRGQTACWYLRHPRTRSDYAHNHATSLANLPPGGFITTSPATGPFWPWSSFSALQPLRLLPPASVVEATNNDRAAITFESHSAVLGRPTHWGGTRSCHAASGRADFGVSQPITRQHDSGRSGRGSGRRRSREGSPAGSPTGLGSLRDLASLAAAVQQHAGAWGQAAAVGKMLAAFEMLGKLGSEPAADRALHHRAMNTLAAAYLPLVPQLPTAKRCVIPLWACAKLGYWEGGLAEALLGRLRDGQLLRDAKTTGQSHAQLWWSVSRAPRDVVALAAPALAVSAGCLLRMAAEELTPRACSNVLYACGRMKHSDPALLHHLTGCLAAKPDPGSQALANTLYSLGELVEDCGHVPRPKDLQLLAQRVVGRLEKYGGSEPRVHEDGDRFIPQALSNMLLGCAKLGCSDPDLLQALAAAAGQAAPRMNGQGLVNSLYALAKLGCNDAVYAPAVQQLCSEACRRVQQAPSDFVPQELSNLLWALAGLRPPGWEHLAGAVAAECRRRRFAGFKPQALSNSVWALAKLGWAEDQGWYEAAVAAAMQPGFMVGAEAQHWSNLWYGLALVRHRPPEELLGVMVDSAEPEQQRRDGLVHQQRPLDILRSCAESQHCANLLWSLAVLGMYERRLVGALTERLLELMRKNPGSLNEQDLANSLWALALMGPRVLVRLGPSVEQLLREVVQRWEETAGAGRGGELPFASEGFVQVWQVQQELVHVGSEVSSGGEQILPGCGSLMAAWSKAAEGKRLAVDSSTSRLQRQVARALDQMKAAGVGIVSVQSECPVEGLCGRVDVLVGLEGGRRVAVEVDGPTHFLANPPHTRTKDGRTQLRDRQLERVFGAGNVVSVPYWEWRTMQGDSERQQGYLRRLLGLGKRLRKQTTS